MLTNAKNRYKLIVVVAVVAAAGGGTVLMFGPLTNLFITTGASSSGTRDRLTHSIAAIFATAETNAESLPEEPANGKSIVFKYPDAAAQNVFLSGDFNDWQKEILVKNAAGVWERKRVLSDDTDHVYQFVVDGKAQSDPLNPVAIDIPQRGPCSVIAAGVTDIAAAVAPAAAIAPPAAQEPAPAIESCVLSGTVRDQKGKPVAKAVVKISSDGEEYLRVLSLKDGTFQVEGLLPGTYAVKAWKERFAPREVNITVSSASFTLDFEITRKK